MVHSTGGSFKIQKVKGSNHMPPSALAVASAKRAYLGGTIENPGTQSSKTFIAEFSGHKWKLIASK